MLIAILVVLVGLLPAVAAGQSTPEATPGSVPPPDAGPRFVLRPADDVDGSFLSLEAEAGSTHTLSVVLGNADEEPLTLRTYDADAFTLVNGGFGTFPEDAEQTGVSTWIDYTAETLDLEAEQAVERELTVNVPADAAPGEYIAGIVLQTAEPIEVEGTGMFDQIVRKSIAVFITVPGERTPSFSLGTPEIVASLAGGRLVTPIENTGNVLVRPTGDVTLTDANGREVLTQQVAMGSVYAGTETTLDIPLPGALAEGDYQVTLSLADPESSAEASVDGAQVTLSREEAAEDPLAITIAEVTPMPSADDVQFASVSLTVENRDVPVSGVQVILGVVHDGEPVEEFVLASAVALQQGETTIEQRYIPAEGWSPGEWTFSVTLESIDPQSGSEATLLATEIDQPIVVD